MRFLIYGLTLFMVLSGLTLEAQASSAALANYLKNKTEITGSLDLYDEALDRVRNLKFMAWQNADQQEEPGVVHGHFRDRTSGDVVDVAFYLTEEGAVEKAVVHKVEKKAASLDKAHLDKVFDDTAVHEAIHAYIKQKSKFTKTFDLFDPGKGAFLKLTFKEFEGDIRRFGIMYIQTVIFSEAGSENEVSLDMTVKNENGQLKVEKVKLR